MEPEVAVEVDDVRCRHRYPRPFPVIQGVAVRHDHVEPVHGAALEEADENRAVRRIAGWAVRCERGSGHKKWIEPEAHQRQTSRLHEHASRDCHRPTLLTNRLSAYPPCISILPQNV